MSRRGWWTTGELAREALPGLPRRSQHVARLARREGWRSRPHPMYPWARLFHEADLPAPVQAALKERGLWADEPADDATAAAHRPSRPSAAPRGRRRQIAGEIEEIAQAAIAERPDIAAVRLAELLTGRGHEVSPRSAQRWLAAWRAAHAPLHQALRSPDRWRGRYLPAFGRRDEDVAAPNDRWEIDGTASDVLLEGGRRCTIYGVVDVWSRRALVLPAWSGTAAALAGVVAVAIRLWGLPRQIRADNGPDFRAASFLGACARLGIEVEHTHPFAPHEKGHVERLLGTWSHDILPLLEEHCGHDVATRQAIRDRQSFAARLAGRGRPVELGLPYAALARLCLRWSLERYGRRPHRALGCSPEERAAAYQGQVRRLEDPAALDLLLPAPSPDVRVVQKRGIAVDGDWYVAPELGALVGERVLVRHEPLDEARILVLDVASTRRICVAECVERLGLTPGEAAARRRLVAVAAGQTAREALSAERRRLRRLQERHALRVIEGTAGTGSVPSAAELVPPAEDRVRLPAPRLVAAAPAETADRDPWPWPVPSIRAVLEAGHALPAWLQAPRPPETGHIVVLTVWRCHRADLADAATRRTLRADLEPDRLLWDAVAGALGEPPPAWIWEADGLVRPPPPELTFATRGAAG